MSSSGRPQRAITLDRFTAWSPELQLMLAGFTDLPQYLRVFMLASERVNRIGHAEFGAGDIVSILDVRPERVSEAIRTCKGRGLLEPESKSRCLVIPRRLMQQAAAASSAICTIHGIY